MLMCKGCGCVQLTTCGDTGEHHVERWSIPTPRKAGAPIDKIDSRAV